MTNKLFYSILIVYSDAETQDLLEQAIESVFPNAKVVTLDNSIDAIFTITVQRLELVILGGISIYSFDESQKYEIAPVGIRGKQQ